VKPSATGSATTPNVQSNGYVIVLTRFCWLSKTNCAKILATTLQDMSPEPHRHTHTHTHTHLHTHKHAANNTRFCYHGW